MTTYHLFLNRLLSGLALLSVLLSSPHHADASCNQIPGPTNTFRGAHATIDRPFASPADLIDIRLSPTCDGTASFDVPQGVAISVIFTPPDGPRNVVVMAPSCAAIDTELAACRAQASVSSVTCLPAGLVEVVDPLRLRFPFPNSDALVDAPFDERTLSGPATIAVTPIGVPLPCSLATTPCTAHPDTLACIDALYAVDGTCGTAPDPTFSHFTALPLPNDYSALCSDPVPPCTARASEMRFTIDSDGNALLPMDWSGILVFNQTIPVERLLLGTSAIPAFPGSTEPVRVPGTDFLQSFSPEGSVLQPVFEAPNDRSATHEVTLFGTADAARTVLRVARRSPERTACTGGGNDGRPCDAAIDCPGGTCGTATCAGGANAGQACHADSDCRGDECGPALFDFRSRLDGRVGPVLIPRFGAGVCEDSGLPCTTDASCGSVRCVGYRIVAKDPVPLDGIIETPDLFVTVVPEAIEGRDLNGDGDATDEVLLLTNRHTGMRQPIGVAPARGRAVTRVHAEPFSSPAVAAENNIVAFLEGEPLQGNMDVNGDGDVFDTPLRILRSGDNGVDDLLPAPPVMASAAPVINGASIVVSDGLVFVRVSEMDAARRTIVRASVTAAGGDANGASGRPSLSKDARQVAFESTATNLITPPLMPAPLAPSPYQGEGRGEVSQLYPLSFVPWATAAGQSRLTSYVADLRGGGPQAVRLDAPMLPPDVAAIQPWLSGDGRFVAVAARDTDGISQIFVYDRDADGNGRFDEPGGTATVMMTLSVDLPPLRGNEDSLFPFITPTGRFVAFQSRATSIRYLDLAPPEWRTYFVDRDSQEDGVFDERGKDADHDTKEDRIALVMASYAGGGGVASAPSTVQPPSMASETKPVVTFSTFDRNVLPRDDNDFCLNLATSSPTCADVVVTHGSGEGNIGASFSSFGEQGNNHSLSPMLSDDGRSVVYASAATNLVPGDTNGQFDIFVHDVAASYYSLLMRPAVGTTTRASVASDGTQANGSSFDNVLGISDEGRYVAFASTASNLVPDDTNDLCDNNLDGQAQENCSDIFIHDRATGFTQRLSVAATGEQANGTSHHAALSGDGRTVAFESTATNLVPNDHNDLCDTDGDGVAHENCPDVFVAGPDRADPAADLNGDGDASDTLLEVFDTRRPDARMSVIAPAGQVAVVGERAAFLSPEQDSGTDLNGDGDTKDAVVQLYTGRDGRVINLQRAARSVALSERWLAALVSEGDEERDLDGDGHRDHLVVHVTSADGTAPWTNVGISATRLDVAGDTVAFTTVELDGQGNLIRGQLLKLYNPGTDTVIDPDQVVEEFVLTADLVAFRTSEALQGQDLNGDGDTDDFVLQLYDVRTQRLINTGQAAIPCVYEACDPRVPYRVTADSVKFLTLESQQGEDLNGDGDMDDLVLQTFNIPMALAAMDAQPTARRRFQRSERQRAGGGMHADVLTTLGAVSVGICSDTGNACAGGADCGANAHCYLPPGGCVTSLHTACDTTLAVNPCGEHQYCVPKAQARGECYQAEGACTSDADCAAPARCQASGQSVQRLISPLLTAGSGHVVFTTAGPDGRLEIARASDTDGDGIADPFDNCPHVANADQADANANSVGDACEASAAAPTPTAVATNTPAIRHENEGCAVDPSPRGSVAYVVLLGACMLWGLQRIRRSNLTLTLSLVRRGNLMGAAVPPIKFRGVPMLRGALLKSNLLAPSPYQGEDRGEVAPAVLGSAMPRAGAPLVLVLIIAAASAAFASNTVATCAGDCDDSGAVTIEELVTLVNIALGSDAAATCAAGDADANGDVTVDEILVAVGRAESDCPVPAEQLAGDVAALTHGLSYLPIFEPVLSAFFSAAGGAGDCPSGGTLSSICEDSGGSVIRIPIVAAQCVIPTFEGTATIDGTTPLVGTGLCPSVLVPGGWQMDVHSSARFENIAGVTLGTGQFDLAAAIQSLRFGASPCRLRGGVAVLDGTFTYALPDGGHVTLTADALNTAFELSDLSLVYTCQPATISLTLDGALQVDDAHADSQVSVRALLRALTVTIHRPSGKVEISGGLIAEWAGGDATLATAASLKRPLDQPCFTGGTLSIDASGERTQLVFRTDGGISVDRGADGSIEATFESCVGAPRPGAVLTP